MSATCLDCQTESTEVIAPRLDDHVFPSKEFLSCDFSQRSDLGLHHLHLLFSSYGEVIGVFGKDFYFFSIIPEFTIYFEKSGIDDPIADIPTA